MWPSKEQKKGTGVDIQEEGGQVSEKLEVLLILVEAETPPKGEPKKGNLSHWTKGIRMAKDLSMTVAPDLVEAGISKSVRSALLEGKVDLCVERGDGGLHP